MPRIPKSFPKSLPRRIPKRLSTVIYSLIILIVTAVGWLIFTFLEQNFGATQKQLKEAKEKIAQLEVANQKLETANLFLKKTRRLAIITDIKKTQENDVVKTSFSFIEVDMADDQDMVDDQDILNYLTPDNINGKKRDFTIDGDIVYIDSLVIKFEDSYVEQGDGLKGCALSLFNRVFSEKIKPEDGFRIDPEGETPKPYKLDSKDSTEFEKELWGNFWRLAQDTKYAKKMGVRAAHGQAISMKLDEKAKYKLEMRNTGELTIKRIEEKIEH